MLVETINHDAAETKTALEGLAGINLVVRPERCVAVRNRHASCTRCSDACTSGAISREDGELRIEHEKCVGCGTCATVCPTCALETRHPNDAVLTAHALASAKSNGGKAVFTCHRCFERNPSCNDADVVRVVCLSRLEETLLMNLFAEGVAEIIAVKADCENCPRHQGARSIQLVQSTMGELMRDWEIDCTFEVLDELPELGIINAEAPYVDTVCDSVPVPGDEQVAMSEQAVEDDGVPSASSSTLGTSHLTHVQADGTLPHFLPVRRGKLLDALAKFGEPQVDSVDSRLWGYITIDADRCCSCRMCTVFCPTGALSRIDADNGLFGIEHYTSECVHCKLCQDICPEQAITASSRVPAKLLATGAVERHIMPLPTWHTGTDQILRRMETQIGGNEVAHSY